MNAIRTALLAMVLTAAPGCAGDRGGVNAIYVDASTGDDTAGTGSGSKPYRTISHGLRAAQAGREACAGEEPYEVVVMPGRYGAGEVFPLTVPAGVMLAGWDDSAVATEVVGSGPYTSANFPSTRFVAIVAGAGSTVVSLRVRAPGAIAVLSEESDAPALLSGNEFVDSDFGLVVAGSARTHVIASVMARNTSSGVEVIGDAAPKLRRNTISSNAVGIAIRGRASPDLGTTTDPGVNTIEGSGACNLLNVTTGVIQARGNSWDENAELFTALATCANGTEIANVVPGGAVLYQRVPSDAPIFAATKTIDIQFPVAGALLETTTPDIAWRTTGKALVVAAIFSKPIAVIAGRITNPTDMVWAWHTGLGTGSEGTVAFSDGDAPRSDDLASSDRPSPLSRGQTYYWAVWAWDEGGRSIAASSASSYFTILN
jgi:hypothetical protein